MKKHLFVVLALILIITSVFSGCSGTKENAISMTEDEQKNIARSALKEYFQIAIDFSKETDQEISQEMSEETYKEELSSRYKNLMTGGLLDELLKFVDEGSVESEYFISTFYPEINNKIKDVKVVAGNSDIIEAEAVVNSEYEFSSMADDFESPDFVNHNRVVGLGQEEFSKLIGQHNPIGITSEQIKKYKYTLTREGSEWKFSKLESSFEETRLKEMKTWDGQEIPLK